MKIIVVTNQKGGVGKTTLAYHVSRYAQQSGLRTLAIDMDEGDLSDMLRVEVTPGMANASQLFNGGMTASELPYSGEIGVIPADFELVDVEMMDMNAAVEAVRKNLAHLRTIFDVCVIDVPPNAARRTISALAVGDATFIPMDVSPFSMKRLPRVMQSIKVARENYNRELKFLGILINRLRTTSKSEREAIPELRDAMGADMLESIVCERSSIGVALEEGRAVWEKIASSSQRTAAREMKDACAEVFARLGMKLEFPKAPVRAKKGMAK